MQAVATRRSSNAVARPVKVVVPLIKAELEAGERAGKEHYRRVGAMLLEVRDQVSANWTSWLSKNFHLSRRTAYDYMQLAEMPRAEFDAAPTLRAAVGKADTATQAWRTVGRAMRSHKVTTGQLSQEAKKDAKDENRLHRLLAVELITIGYKALAANLHPDRPEGSTEAMRRLNRVRTELIAVAESRQFV